MAKLIVPMSTFTPRGTAPRLLSNGYDTVYGVMGATRAEYRQIMMKSGADLRRMAVDWKAMPKSCMLMANWTNHMSFAARRANIATIRRIAGPYPLP